MFLPNTPCVSDSTCSSCGRITEALILEAVITLAVIALVMVHLVPSTVFSFLMAKSFHSYGEGLLYAASRVLCICVESLVSHSEIAGLNREGTEWMYILNWP